jgi:hypothetical protein
MNQQTVALVPYIFGLPAELIKIITNVDWKTLTMTCKFLNDFYKNLAVNVIVLYGSQNDLSLCNDSIKALYLHMKHYGYVCFNYIPMSEFRDDDDSYVVLCLNEKLNVPKMLNPKSVSSIIISSSSENKFAPDVSFFQKFEKLDSLLHKGIDFKVDVTLIFSKLRLRFISLNQCDLEACNVSTMSDNCTTLQHLQLIGCKWPQDTRLLLPENLKRFELNKCSFVENLDISRPMGLESLILLMKRFPFYLKAQTEFAYLKNLELDGSLQFEIDTFGHFENLGSLEKLTLHNSSTFQSPIPSRFVVHDFKKRHLKFSNSPNFKVLRIVDPSFEPGNILSCELAKGYGEVTVMLILKNKLTDLQKLQRDPQNSNRIPIEFEIKKEVEEKIEEKVAGKPISAKKHKSAGKHKSTEKCVIC